MIDLWWILHSLIFTVCDGGASMDSYSPKKCQRLFRVSHHVQQLFFFEEQWQRGMVGQRMFLR